MIDHDDDARTRSPPGLPTGSVTSRCQPEWQPAISLRAAAAGAVGAPRRLIPHARASGPVAGAKGCKVTGTARSHVRCH
eukprot:2253454-Rhodomonas_salina.2